MVPVLHTAIWPGSRPTPRAARAPMAAASSRPGDPVAALALPALTTTPCRAAGSRERVCRTAAEGSALTVSTSAEAAGRRLTSRPMSSANDPLRPQAAEPAAKPCGVVTPPPARGVTPSGSPTQSARRTGGGVR